MNQGLRVVLATVLSGAVLFGYTYFFAPPVSQPVVAEKRNLRLRLL